MKKVKISFKRNDLPDCIDVQFHASEQDGQVRELMELVAARQQLLTATGKNGTLLRFDLDSILCVSSAGKYTEIVTEAERVTVRQSLSELERQLRDSSFFIRVSRYELVNLGKIRKYDFALTGTLRMEFVNGMETWASRRCIPAIRVRLKEREERNT